MSAKQKGEAWEHEVFVNWLYISIGYDIAPKPKKGG